jgi:hypothetical protein
MPYIPGSYVPAGDIYPFWHYPDDFQNVRLAAEPVSASQVIATNNRLSDFIMPWGILRSAPLYSFLPPLLAAGTSKREVRLIDAVMTGGRTFMLTSKSNQSLGLPPRIYLDLQKLGWGEGWLEARVEIKGAGTLLHRAKLRPNALETLLRKNKAFGHAYWTACTSSAAALVCTEEDYMKRNLGGQSERYSHHAVVASCNLLQRSAIKFVPTWIALTQSDRAHRNLKLLSAALPTPQKLHQGKWACEIRFTPSTVRALYFTATRNDEQLARVCSRVSLNQNELEMTSKEIIGDVRRYLEILALTTQEAPSQGFHWIKIGDVNELFYPDRNGEFPDANAFREKKYAWFIAKDDVIVRRAGKFFADMESYFGRDVGFYSGSEPLLWFHQELLILAVLRDHCHVCTRFALACELLGGGIPSHEKRVSLKRAILASIIKDVNRSDFVGLHFGKRNVIVDIRYKNLNNLEKRFTIPRYQLAEDFI